MSKVEKTKNKARYWVGVCYPENMREDWKETIGDLLGLPYCYCIHDKDKIKEDAKEEEDRKIHVHIIIAYGGPATYASALNAFNALSKEGATCCPFCESINNIKNKYDYLCHETETAKAQGKYQYPHNERICGNGFDIGSYMQVSQKDKIEMVKELSQVVSEYSFSNFIDLNDFIIENFDAQHYEVFLSYNGYFERLTRGVYLKHKEMYEK